MTELFPPITPHPEPHPERVRHFAAAVQRRRRARALLAGGTALVVALAIALPLTLTSGRSASRVHVVSPGPGTTVAPPTTVTTTPAPAAEATTTTSPIAPQPGCPASQLTVTEGAFDGAMSHGGFDVVFTNTGPPCIMAGYPGFEAVDAAGHDLGDATRTPAQASPVALATGASATAQVYGINAEAKVVANCPVPDHYLVTPPGQTRSFTLPVSVVGLCQVTIKPVVAAASATTPTATVGWQSRPLPAGLTGTISDVACPTTTTCIAVGGDPGGSGSGFVLRSTDAGTTWSEQVVTHIGSTTGVTLERVTCTSASTCLAVGFPSSANGAVAALVDGVHTPQAVTLPPGVSAIGVTCPTVSTCLVAEGPDVARSTDGGHTWKAITLGGQMANVDAVACSSATHCIAGGDDGQATCCQTGVAAVSDDAGATWSTPRTVDQPGQDSLFEISCVGADCLGIDGTDGTDSFGQGALQRSTDGGRTWSFVAGVHGENVACDAATRRCDVLGAHFDGTTFHATGFESRDAGATWTPLPAPPGAGSNALAFAGTRIVGVGSLQAAEIVTYDS